jgi:hypothetical protein
MEYLIVAVILYFILQTAGNLVYILRGGGASSTTRDASSPPTHGWEGPSPRRQMEGLTDHPTFWGHDVDDATWHDIRE